MEPQITLCRSVCASCSLACLLFSLPLCRCCLGRDTRPLRVTWQSARRHSKSRPAPPCLVAALSASDASLDVSRDELAVHVVLCSHTGPPLPTVHVANRRQALLSAICLSDINEPGNFSTAACTADVFVRVCATLAFFSSQCCRPTYLTLSKFSGQDYCSDSACRLSTEYCNSQLCWRFETKIKSVKGVFLRTIQTFQTFGCFN